MTVEPTSASQSPAAPVAPASAPVSPTTPVTSAPATPATASTAAPATAAVDVKAAAPLAPAADAIAAPPVSQTILGAEPVKAEAKTEAKTDAPVEDKPAEAKAEAPKTEDAKKDAPAGDKPAEQTKEEAAQSDAPAQLPTYDPFKMPEGMTADEKGLGEFTKILSDIELAKGDHAKMQESGQRLVDYHIAEVQGVLKRQTEFYLNAFEKQKTEWKETFMKDPEIGGNRWETTAAKANEFITTHGGTPEQQKELRQLMEVTGIGNHRAMLRVFATAMANMSEGKPLPASKPESRPVSKIEKRYGKTT